MNNVLRLIKLSASIAAISISSIIAFIIVEYSYRQIKGTSSTNSYVNRTMLFDLGNNFKNQDGYFLYHPNEEIRSVTLYSKAQIDSIDDIVIEYDYLIKTNNAGLVMLNNLSLYESVFFIVGDSFTEGQGASPWFYDFEASINISGSKLVNLGILGTGPQQWENLATAITKDFKLDVKGIVVNIIPADMVRSVWLFKERELDCLYNSSCNYNFGFQGFDFNIYEDQKDIKLAVMERLVGSNYSNLDLYSLKQFLKKSLVISDIYTYLIERLWDHQIRLNQNALLALDKSVNGNLYVNVLSQKNLNSSNFNEDYSARTLIGFLKKNNIDFKWCNIPSYGFHRYDSHPNSKGYRVVSRCTDEALERVESVH